MFIELLYFLTIRPLEILFETIFFIIYRYMGKPFPTIIALSIFVNILVFPLYKRADKLQEGQRALEKSMEERLSHIRKTFKGDERVMMTQAYYRLCGYKPVYALRGASSLLLQIPFFIAAYRFLSGLELLKGMPSILLHLPWNAGEPSFLINDLGSPDRMLELGSMTVNALPVLMTLINIVSGTIYSKGHPRKEKVQLYVTALVFLVLLYNSPSGLVIYWTCNNIFSLCKNAVQKLCKEKNDKSLDDVHDKIYDRVFATAALFMAFMTGMFIPSNIISASPTEFISSSGIFNPSEYLLYSLSLGIGFFAAWTGIYYYFSPGRVRKVMTWGMSVICGMSFINYMMSGSGLGNISSELKYDNAPVFDRGTVIVNIILILLASVLIATVCRYKIVIIRSLILAGGFAIISVSLLNVHQINQDYREFTKMYETSDAYGLFPEINLSENGKNVIILMLDRAMGPVVPFLVYERPDLLDSFDGFTYYNETVSLGRSTNFGMPSVFGGYEYSPYEMNKRDDMLLSEKTNEALKVLPVLFLQNGFNVTVMDPPYAGYSEIPDLSIYDDYPEIRKYISKGKFYSESGDYDNRSVSGLKRNLFCFGFMKTVSPIVFQNVFYDDGNYNGYRGSTWYDTFENEENDFWKYYQGTENTLIADGLDITFMDWYTVLENLKDITVINDDGGDEFAMLYNAAPHSPVLLQMPDYVPSSHVNNTDYYEGDYYELNGMKMNLDTVPRVSHYQVNMACLLRVGEWLDYLKEKGVYDNTRIIIVADHGYSLGWFDGFKFGIDPSNLNYCEHFLPLLMVKDFDSHGFNISTELMTNADACPLAVRDVIENPVNPFTGNALDGHEKNEGGIKIISLDSGNLKDNMGYRFAPSEWYTVDGNPYDKNNWEYLGYE